MSNGLPTLWHIPVSHYNEKARWALAHKGIEHERRAPPPGGHVAVALWLTRGSEFTFPVLTIDGRHIGDSTAIIAALEERQPEPPLYPADPDQRRRALALEDFFDEELGPHSRLLAWHELLSDGDRFRDIVEQSVPPPARRVGGLVDRLRRRLHQASLRRRRQRQGGAGAGQDPRRPRPPRGELEAEGSGYLVGDEFTVADLTAASLFYPVVLPDEGPTEGDGTAAAGMEAFRDPLRERPGYLWVEEMFRRHRKPVSVATA